MLAHLRVGTREGDIHQCCLLSNSNIFSSLICSEASEGGKKVKKKCLESICSLIYFQAGQPMGGGPKWAALANPLVNIFQS